MTTDPVLVVELVALAILAPVAAFAIVGERSMRRRLAHAQRVDVYLASLERWPFREAP